MVKNNYNAKVWTKTFKIPENVYIEQRVDINKVDPDFYKKGDLIYIKKDNSIYIKK